MSIARDASSRGLDGFEFDSRTDTPLRVAEGVREFGCAVVRQAFAPPTLAAFRTRVAQGFGTINDLLVAKGRDRVHETCAAIADSSVADGEVIAPSFKGTPIRFVGALDDAYYAGFSQHFRHDLLKIIAGTFVCQVFRTLIGGPMLLPLQHARVREQTAAMPEGALPLHQDAGAVAEGFDRPVYTCWVPFQDCGVTAPGLEFLPRRLDRILPVTAGAGKYAFGVDPAQLSQDIVDGLRHPPFALGDCLIFGELTLHRTFLVPGMSITRYSSDIRACSADRPPTFMKDVPAAHL